jgi:hypothetical protein
VHRRRCYALGAWLAIVGCTASQQDNRAADRDRATESARSTGVPPMPPGIACQTMGTPQLPPAVTSIVLRTSSGTVVPRSAIGARPLLAPICPAGTVPGAVAGVAHPAPPGQPAIRYPKGNPLLSGRERIVLPDHAGGALTETVRSEPVLYSINELYSLDNASASQTPPTPTVATSVCDGDWHPQDGVCYYYGASGGSRTVDGAGMVLSVERPRFVSSPDVIGHTLNEISVQGGPQNGNIVELGWSVSSDQFGDNDPHLFVYRWTSWGDDHDCYNYQCGWIQSSNVYYPGQNLSALIGKQVFVGYAHYHGGWWAWFDGEWLGYFPDAIWKSQLTKATLVQWFGEVATGKGAPPGTEMGNGKLPGDQAAAAMTNICDLDIANWTCTDRSPLPLYLRAKPGEYEIESTGDGSVRYGGPGHP